MNQGAMADATFSAIRRAEQLQALSLEYIHAQYSVPDKAKDIFEMTFEDFNKELEHAYQTNTIDALNEKYSRILMPLVQNISTPSAPSAPQQQGQQ